MGTTARGVDCGVVEWVKRGTLRWFEHVERRNENEFVKRVYKSEIEEPSVRGRPPVKCIIRVEEYWRERVDRQGFDQAERECQNTERQRLFCRGHHLREVPGGGQGIRDLDRQID